MATRKIYTSINLNSNELSDFFIGHRTSDPAPLEGGVYYNTLLHDFIVCRNGKWEPLLHGYWAVDSDGNLVTDKQVVIKNNAIIHGDTASGGTGEDTDARGTVIGVKVGDKTYTDVTAGILDMSAAFEGLQVEIDLSPYATKDFVAGSIADLVNGAPTTLDTLKEIADALAENEDVVAALDSAIGTKASQSDLTSAMLRIGTLESTLKTEQGYIDTLQGYFSGGTAKKATADAKGNVIDTYYTPLATHNALATRVSATEKNITNLSSSKADKSTTLAGYGITDAYTKAQTDSKVEAVNTAITALDTKYSPVKTWYDALSSLIVEEEGNVRIKTNLIVDGDTASGGTGESTDAVGTVTGILVNGMTKSPTNGIITLDDYPTLAVHNALVTRVSALEGKATAVSFSQTLTGGKQIGVLTIDGSSKVLYAPSTYAWSEITGKPTTLSGYGITDAYTKTTVDSKLSGYLPLSGGTLGNTTVYKSNQNDIWSIGGEPYTLRVSRSSGWACHLIDIYNTYNGSSAKGFLGAYGSVGEVSRIFIALNEQGYSNASLIVEQDAVYHKANLLLHSGNYSNYALPLTGGTLRNTTYSTVLTIDGAVNSLIDFKSSGTKIGTLGMLQNGTLIQVNPDTAESYVILHSGNIGNYALKTDGSNVMTGNLTLQGSYLVFKSKDGSTQYGAYNVNSGNNTPIYLYNGAWKTIAFTDSNVASAQKLVNANGYTYAITYNTDKIAVFGDGTAQNGYKTYLDGTSISLRYGTASATGLILNSAGNVLIGTTTDGGEKLQIEGVLKVYEPTNRRLYTRISSSSIQVGYASSYTGGYNAGLSYGEDGTAVGYIAGMNHNAGTTGRLFFYGGPRESAAVYIRETGNVGIGTNAPEYKLDVDGAILATTFRKRTATSNRVLCTHDGETLIIGDVVDTTIFRGSTIGFQTVIGTRVATMTSTGVGIGTSSPAYKLDVAGTARATGDMRVGSAVYAAQDTAYGVEAYGGDNGGLLGVHAAGTWKCVNVRLNPDKSTYFYGAATVNGALTATAVAASYIIKSDEFYIGSGTLGVSSASALVYTYGTTPIQLYTNAARRLTVRYDGITEVTAGLNVTASANADNGGVSGVAGVFLRTEGGIDISHASTPYIDFHYANSTADYSVRLVCKAANILAFTGGYFAPYTSGGGSLGSETWRWNILWAKGINVTGNTDISGALTVGAGATVTGDLIVSGDVASGSDIRYKDIIRDETIEIKRIAEAPLFTFRWNDREDDTVHLGSSAQYWDDIAPWLVSGTDFKTLNYAALGVAMGISVAKKTLNLEERIEVLEKENKALKAELRRIQHGNLC